MRVFIYWCIYNITCLINYLENVIFWIIWYNWYSGYLSCEFFHCCTDIFICICCCCFKLLGPKYFLVVGDGFPKQEEYKYPILICTYFIIYMFNYNLNFIVVLQPFSAASPLTYYLPADSTTVGSPEHTLTSLISVTSLLLVKWWNNLTPLTYEFP